MEEKHSLSINDFEAIIHLWGWGGELWPKVYILYKTQNGSELNINHKLIKLWEKSRKCWDLGPDKEFSDLIPKGQSIKRKNDNLDFTKIKNFYSTKNHV